MAIAELASHVPQLTLITQNVDDLHERAGSREVIHLHGSLHRPRCFACAREPAEPLPAPDEPEAGRRLEPPRCRHCGGRLRPGVVWFGESLPGDALRAAFAAAQACDLLLSVGTSGVVYPAAEVPHLARAAGATLVHVNPQGEAPQSAHEHLLALPAGQACRSWFARLSAADRRANRPKAVSAQPFRTEVVQPPRAAGGDSHPGQARAGPPAGAAAVPRHSWHATR